MTGEYPMTETGPVCHRRRRCSHTNDAYVTVLSGTLGWASTQGSASTATRTALQPPGGPPPEEADVVSEGRLRSVAATRELK